MTDELILTQESFPGIFFDFHKLNFEDKDHASLDNTAIFFM